MPIIKRQGETMKKNSKKISLVIEDVIGIAVTLSVGSAALGICLLLGLVFL